MTMLRFLHLIFWAAAYSQSAFAMAPSGEDWFTIKTPHFRVHHTLPLEPYARAVSQTLERQLPELEKRMNWKAPAPVDIIVMDTSDSANGATMNYPNDSIELFSAPFNSDSVLAYYENWNNEIATHELTHMVANDGSRGFYKALRAIFGSWVKPNGIQPVWLSEGLAVFQETSLTRGGRGRSPLLDAILRTAVIHNKLNDSSYTSIDRFNDGVPWWPAGNTQYLIGYTAQSLLTKKVPNLSGKISYENADTMIFAPDRVAVAVTGQDWSTIWASATTTLKPRYSQSQGPALNCHLTQSGAFTGGQALSSDGWVYFSEQDWHHGYHLARVRANQRCDSDGVERLTRKEYDGPTQVAVSPNGKKIAYAAYDPGYENFFSDIYLWSESSGVERLTKDERARDPAFLDDTSLLMIRANADTSESVVQRNINGSDEQVLFTGKPLERFSGLVARGKHVLFSLHYNDGHEKIVELRGKEITALVKEVDKDREFERNPFLSHDGTLYFAASYGHGPQEIYRWDATTHAAVRVLTSESGYLDRPVLLPDDNSLVVQTYGLDGLDIVRAQMDPSLARTLVKTGEPKEDLHEYLTGEKPGARAQDGRDIELPPSVPYSIGDSATSLWPQYWFPELTFAQDGALIGASTSGNDALNYHRYYAIVQYDTRATFPLYEAFYRNRVYTTNFHFQADQTNDYFLSSKSSNRNATYSAEAIFPLWDASISFGGAYRQRKLFGAQSNNGLFFNNIGYNRSGSTPSAVEPNWGVTFNNYVAAYPSSNNESTFVDERPEFTVYTRGLKASHSISVGVAAGISTNKFLASSYYQGGGASPLSNSAYIVRGYPTDTLFGQKVATANVAYSLPLWQIYHGFNTNPFFLSNLGVRFLGDAGSASYMGVYSGDTILYYESGKLLSRVIYGLGADLVANGTILYHVPVRLETGIHYGTNKRYGGTTLYYLGVSVSINRGTMREAADRNAQHRL
jgi:hypothetical protein